ncbi:hypothetical protein [Flavobacterium limi]|uniref:Tetratricopeptide repeat-containing protein n=1 Tax=Flavobacterium limi TaxID=2045105 RepID=A0ABQ1UZJ0_9FLAO|nr:hypothetical protein [Flavobacterium limi]GGF29774.1 hypothetical protein GCM10011518_43800 [Flavobacterium limi]
MKKFLVFTVLLVSSFSRTLACGYSPNGEDVRYSICKPEYFKYASYKAFYYNADLWGFDYDRDPNSYKLIDANILDWYNFTNRKVSIEDIEDFNFNLTYTDVHSQSDNEFIKYLYVNNKTEAIRYLKIAKSCELTNDSDDVWERNENENNQRRSQLLAKIIKITNSEKNQYFKRKYAFLTIRLAYYSGDINMIKDVFKSNFKEGKKDYLYYWSLFFYTFTQENQAYMVDVANLMANCPEKKYASYYFFHEKFKIDEALKLSKTKEEIANVYAYASMQKKDKNIHYLKEIYKNNPKSEILGFLLLRELNKIEDWVYTPYYSNYTPSTDFENFWSNDKNKITTETLRNQSEVDRLYAQEILDFIKSIEINKIHDPVVWKAVQINLEFITRHYNDCLQNITLFKKQYPSEKVIEEIEKIKALCITADQENGKAVIKPEIESVILKYKDDERFIFALGRELEFKGNIVDGLALMSLIEGTTNEGYNSDDVEWRDNRIKTSGNLAEFYRYFDYVDFVYAAKDLQKIINRVENENWSEFQKNIYTKISKDKDYLKDLLGTKYIRENQLSNALKTFRSLDKKYWDDNYNAWERGEYDENYVFNQNPFYDFKHTKDFIEHKEKYIVTKLSVTERLIKYTNLANNPKTKDRDYYYFLIANCYYNMSDYGNSWMMRRYFSSGYDIYHGKESYIDEIEYRNKLKAVANYKLAFQNAKTDKFKALCLRMIDFAEKEEYTNSSRVTKQFPEFASDLSGCENLESYFNARR